MAGRRRFNHLFEELSVAVGRLAPRYALWLDMQEHGIDPEALGRRELLDFVDWRLADFLAEHRLSMTGREIGRLRRSLQRFDPRHPTPYETMERLGSARF